MSICGKGRQPFTVVVNNFPINQFEEYQIEKYLHQLTDEVVLIKENLLAK